MPEPDLEAALRRQLRELEARLQESEDTLDAIRRGAIDALVVSGGQQHRVYTLESADRPYRVLIEQMREGAVTLSPDGTILYGNHRLSEMLELPQEQVIGRDLGLFLPEGERPVLAWLLREGGRGELTLRGARGGEMPVAASLGWLAVEGEGAVLCGVLSDLSAQRAHLREVSRANALLRAEIAQREAAEAALRQSQKMEAVGQLTGGIAHDFNNLLTGITGSLELMQEAVLRGRIVGLERYVASAMASAHRAAALTHRLLAFSRRQTLAPQPLSPNRLVEGMAELLSRTVGPAIALRTELADDAGTILCDPSQMENALLNLAINARDAMPDGGTLVIGTANVLATPEACREAGMAPGPCVALFVSDTGIGMSPETAARAFDPFFTTKPAGEGTGLGLSMIYGFARQSGGQAMIESALGQGTTVWLYLPRHEGMAEEAPKGAVATPAAGRGETVLLVDDEAVIRMLMGEALRKLGYATLEAADGPTALRLLQGGERLDLMVTDLGLPGGLNGRELAEAARRTQPGLKVLFITGFAEAAGLDARGLDAGTEMLPKPFSLEALATRIRAMLDRPPSPA
ncbi:PAS domain-containing sensor histidine kinase [Teichococcus oryzae]|uniref:histidine kinase n=1 Tax=Teichococcus oryzae TaxID=1608942 RepID=A0A5B2TJB5_9PROT|nr:PAS domain-containing sensor histidine kinase [Pseudoroseomonas oryzae]KAA2214173.1 response regulator [Pseudoroseomonas oryzae]